VDARFHGGRPWLAPPIPTGGTKARCVAAEAAGIKSYQPSGGYDTVIADVTKAPIVAPPAFCASIHR
jgi:hypothetical protein